MSVWCEHWKSHFSMSSCEKVHSQKKKKNYEITTTHCILSLELNWVNTVIIIFEMHQD